MPLYITSPLATRDEGKVQPRFFASPSDFAVGVENRLKILNWIQPLWFWTWLEWQLLARGHYIPKRLQKYAQPDVAEYVAALRTAGINPLSHNPFTSTLPTNSFLTRYKEGARYHGLKYVPQNQNEIHLEENHFGDIQYMIATTLEKKRGNAFCPECDASVKGKVITKRVEDYHGAGGRSFWCDKGHPLFYTFDWIS